MVDLELKRNIGESRGFERDLWVEVDVVEVLVLFVGVERGSREREEEVCFLDWKGKCKFIVDWICFYYL